ncbi:MAG: acyltransferase [Bauldia sp.]|nr:acyltransferase [Bauldia sp.]
MYFGVFRFLLALCVVAQHLQNLPPANLKAALEPLEIGSNAVLAFFMLSGYIITSAYYRFYYNRPVNFIINRLLRVYPTYIIALFLFIAITYAIYPSIDIVIPDTGTSYFSGMTPENIVSNIFLLIPFYDRLPFVAVSVPFIGIAWAVRVEMLFYIFFFAAALFCSLSGRSLRRILAILFPVFVALFLYQYVTTRTTQLQFIPYFAFGIAAFFAEQNHLARMRGMPGSLGQFFGSFGSPLLAMSICLVLIVMHQLGRPSHHEVGFARDFGLQLAIILSFIGAFLVLLWVSITDRISSAATKRTDKALGDLSYPLYLNHIIWILVLDRIVQHSLGATFFAVAVAIGYSAIVSRLSEPFFVALRDRIRGQSLGLRDPVPSSGAMTTKAHYSPSPGPS